MIVARIKSSIVLDPQENDTFESYKKRFSTAVVAAWEIEGCTFKQVLPQVMHGASDNGNGTYTNPDGGTVDADGNVTYPEPEPEPEPEE